MDANTLLRQLPKVDALLDREDLAALSGVVPRGLVVEAVRESIDDARASVLAGTPVDVGSDAIAADAVRRANAKNRRSLRRVINATGIVVHTNLGRSPLADSAVAAVDEVARGYSTLEFDVESGERGSRHVHVEELICRLTGAEAAMAVNNNAAAVMLALAGLARGKEAIVSRGQLVEIGGSFRVPDVMAESGATMVEVGTTNKTHLRDYESAITDKTGLLLKVHTSNYRVVGFTEEVELGELVELGARHGVPVMEDQGSGVLVDLRQWKLPYEPTVSESVAAGADVVTCSGDKLLGGPQAGILAGRYHVISALKKHPLARAVRLDKMTLAALEATLRLYLEPERAYREVPTLRMLSETKTEVAERAARLADEIKRACGGCYLTGTHDDVSRAGGGAMPMADIPTVVVALVPQKFSVVELESRLRLGEPHVIARISDDRLLLDPRTLSPRDEADVVAALARIAADAAG
ncbi:MAG TPA: L-seryl-tRNA(Sec) selenium transferase [Coriobacteriia bacterium]|nr:L-seryl-tRNA(Sec) selenium transferase [Coriobacteriia bacterium]